MKKSLLLIPSLVAISTTPFIGLTSCFESEEDDPKPGPTPPEPTENTMTVSFQKYEKNPDLWYSTNGKDWTQVKQSGKIALSGDQLWLKGNNPSGLSDGYSKTYITLKGSIHLQGNCMDLIDGDITKDNIKQIPCSSCFSGLFWGSTGLKSLPSNYLSANTLTEDCYYRMFSQCDGLTSLPNNLFASVETLAGCCFQSMFCECTGLTSLPENLFSSSWTLTGSCFYGMFQDCTNLLSLPENLLPYKILNVNCYCAMFWGCSSLTALPSNLFPTEVQLKKDCFYGMFYDCTNLLSLPKNFLQFSPLADGCYNGMFAGCERLKIRENGEHDPEKMIFKCPSTSGFENNPTEGMFAYTGGDFKGTPTQDNTYYWY